MKDKINSDTLITVVENLAGSCCPYGDTNIDKERLCNLRLKIDLAQEMLKDIFEAGCFYDESAWSMKNIATEANDYLADVRNWLNEVERLRTTSKTKAWIKRSSVGNYECPHCGKEVIINDDIYDFCPGCAKPLRTEEVRNG